jgi:chemosensory pili system protein ChpC
MLHEQILLPNASLAEIVTYAEPRVLENSPEWLLGMLPWRGLEVPLVSFEVLQGGHKTETDKGSRIAILNALGGNPDLPFFAVVVQGIPHLVLANQSVVTALAEDKAEQEGVLSHVLIEAEPAIIPDLDRMESIILAEKSLFK